MKRGLLMLLIAACSAPAVPDAGPPDSGPVDAGPPVQQHCVSSSCAVTTGVWQVIFTGVSANPICRPVDEQVQLSSDGGTVCMLRAVDGGSDGGCSFVFVLRTDTDSGISLVDTWDITRADAGHIYGTWTTNVSGAAMCTATYMIHAVD